MLLSSSGRKFAGLGIALAWAAQARAAVVISDFDDTVKVTRVQSSWETVRRSLFSQATFAGMETLFGALTSAQTSNEASALYFVSGSPQSLRSRISRTLRERGYPSPNFVILRDWLAGERTEEFKLRQIGQILESRPEPVILFGDDEQSDPEIFAQVRAVFPDRISATYIHGIRCRALPQGQIRYLTAADLALHEVLAGRLSLAQAAEVAERVASAPSNEEVGMRGMSCLEATQHPPSEELLPVVLRKHGQSAETRRLWNATYAAEARFLRMCLESI